MQNNAHIDHGRGFDWGRASLDYANYRDIYPQAFYQKILDYGLCVKGQQVLDLGTGTGVLPRNLYPYGAQFTGIDSSENQIAQAIALAQKDRLEITFQCAPAEKCGFAAASFHVVTACQCFTYFDHAALAPLIHNWLKPHGTFAILYMAWLPFEDAIAGKSEALIMQFNPSWTGCGETRHAISVPDIYRQYFTVERQDVFDLSVPFTAERWNGRIKTCRGIEASLSDPEIAQFDAAHRQMLHEIAPQDFNVLHYAAMTTLVKK